MDVEVANDARARLVEVLRVHDRVGEGHVLRQGRAATECAGRAPPITHAAGDRADVVADVAAPDLTKA